jgi:dTDP-glucose 4,6-dehydratase
MKKTILVTGGAGFIGSHVIRRLVNRYPEYTIINYDKLTYAGNLENLKDIDQKSNYVFIKGDILDGDKLKEVFSQHEISGVIHLAAESHVDRSLNNPDEFAITNVIGTIRVLQAAKNAWRGHWEGKRFYHISTDEVYGSVDHGKFFTEQTPIDPQSPYSSSKASSDHFVSAYGNSYKMPVLISRCSNNYGPNHFPEKLIPLMINNILQKKPLPVYGKGENVRDWLFVEDHAAAIDTIFHTGKIGEVYNIGGNNEWKNIDLVHLLCRVMDKKLNRAEGESASLITYAIDASKLMNQLGWKPTVTFEQGLEKTVDWYLNNPEWLNHVTSGAYQHYYQNMYNNR